MTARTVQMSTASTTIKAASEKWELSKTDIGRSFGVSRRTVTRWANRKSAPSPKHQEHMEQLRVLENLLDSVFDTREEALEWFYSPVPAFRGRTPHGLFKQGEIETIIEALATHHAGAFV